MGVEEVVHDDGGYGDCEEEDREEEDREEGGHKEKVCEDAGGAVVH